LHQVLLAHEIHAREILRRLRLVQLLLQRLDLRRTHWHLQVLEPRLRALHALLGLGARLALGLLLEDEDRFPGLDLVATPHEELLQLPGVGRRKQHVFTLDVTLPDAFFLLLATDKQRSEEAEGSLHRLAFASARAWGLSRASCSTAQPITHEWKKATLSGSVAMPPAASTGVMRPRNSATNLRMPCLIFGSRSAAPTRPSMTRARRLSAAR